MTLADLALCLLLGAGDACPPPVRLRGRATVYHAGDGQSGARWGCVAAARRWTGSARFDDAVPAVAIRGRPSLCGRRLVVEHGARRIVVVRLDTGPWGQDCPAGYRVGTRLGPGCRWRGVADLTPPAARALGLRGQGTARAGDVRVRW